MIYNFEVYSFCKLILIILFSISFIFVTIVFCFWCIYILDAIRRKWKFYKNTSNQSLERDGYNQEEIMVYNAKTEFVKYVFIFFINLLEWAAIVFMSFNNIPNLILEYSIHSLNETYHGNSSQDHELEHSDELTELKHILSSLPTYNWGICCIILSMVLNASLCMYLAARQAKLCWMKSNKIPYLIVFFLISLITTQTISGIYFPIYILICDLCYTLLLTSALLFLVKQYRKLLMVINWSIVDLQISGNTYLLQKQIQMKRRFTRIFKLFFVGYFFVLPAVIMGMAINLGLIYFQQQKSSRILEVYKEVYDVSYLINMIVALTGTIVIFLPYIGFGFSTMCVILWRQIDGKTGYKTHSKYSLNTPLI